MARPGMRGAAAARLGTRGRTVTRPRAGPRMMALGRRAVPASNRRDGSLADFNVFGGFVAAGFGFGAFLIRDLAADFGPAASAAFLRAAFFPTAFAPVFLAGF